MLKYPRPGAVKTRLIPALGAQRACDLHRALVARTLAEVRTFSRHSTETVAVEVRLAGAPDDAAARAWLGEGPAIRDQGDGDLGARMSRAVEAAFYEGATAVVVIGGDCPQLGAEQLAAAFAALGESDAVLGPATDGGYYLIGMRRRLPELFQGIAWGGAEVLAKTLAVAQGLGVEPARLATLRDLDVPEDLAIWAETAEAQIAGRGGVSVVIAALNEETLLPKTLAAVRRERPHELVVVDGGSSDATVAMARAHDATVLAAPAGRAGQLNRGAAIATGEYLLFLHADTLLPEGYVETVRATLAQPGVSGGAFRFSTAGDFRGRRLIERGTNWRAANLQLPYGDQGLFVRRDTFFHAGGFPEQPIMEDFELARRLRRIGRVALAPTSVVTSGRRWRRLGPLRTTLVNQGVILGYAFGISPARLARWYRGALAKTRDAGE